MADIIPYKKTTEAAKDREYVKNIVSSTYLTKLIDPLRLKQSVDLCVKLLRPYKDKFDAVAFTGMSGTLIGPPVALRLRKSFIMVRKPDTSTHSLFDVEGDYGARRYVILDDFRASGETEKRIRKAIQKAIPDAKCIGLVPAVELDILLPHESPILSPLRIEDDIPVVSD